MTEPLLMARAVTKRFAGTVALDGVDFDVNPGEVHALVGENGAGKSTLLRILGGLEEPSSGAIEVGGRSFKSLDPRLAKTLGIATVPQHVELAEDLSVADNLFLGRWPTRAGVVDGRRLSTESLRLLRALEIHVDPHALVRTLSYVEKQMVEIAKITESFSPRVIILDEPTAALSVAEVRILFSLVSRLKSQGVGVIYVSHYLSEVSQIGDRVTVLRDGTVVHRSEASGITTAMLAGWMVGDMPELYPTRTTLPGEVVLVLDRVVVGRVGPISLEVRAGEILGIAAPKGEGLSPFLRAVCGIEGRIEGGSLDFPSAHRRRRSQRIGYLSEDRGTWGIITGRNVRENLTVTHLKEVSGLFGVIRGRAERLLAAGLQGEYLVRGPGLEAEISQLSGGNQQKVLLARLLSSQQPSYILDDPTFGVDVRSKAEINKLLNRAVEDERAAVLLATSDLSELLEMSDRVVILLGGRLTSEWRRGQLSLPELERLLETSTAGAA